MLINVLLLDSNLSAEKMDILESKRLLNKAPPLILFFSLNEIDIELLTDQIMCEYFILKDSIQNTNQISTQVRTGAFNTEKYPQLKKSAIYQFVCCPRNLEYFLDYCKVADYVIFVHSLQFIDILNLNSNPRDNLNVIDELGNKAISSLRAQGQLSSFSIFVNMPSSNLNKIKDIKFYCNRLIKEEFNEESSCYYIDNKSDLLKLFLNIQNNQNLKLKWRNERAYFLVDKIEKTIDEDSKPQIMISGFLKGNCNLENIWYITGLGNFESKKIKEQIMLRSGGCFEETTFSTVHDPTNKFNDINSSKIDEEINVEPNVIESDPILEFNQINNEIQKLTLLTSECKIKRFK